MVYSTLIKTSAKFISSSSSSYVVSHSFHKQGNSSILLCLFFRARDFRSAWGFTYLLHCTFPNLRALVPPRRIRAVMEGFKKFHAPVTASSEWKKKRISDALHLLALETRSVCEARSKSCSVFRHHHLPVRVHIIANCYSFFGSSQFAKSTSRFKP